MTAFLCDRFDVEVSDENCATCHMTRMKPHHMVDTTKQCRDLWKSKNKLKPSDYKVAAAGGL